MKKIAISARPTGASNRLSPDEWINDKDAGRGGEPMKRLTIDVSGKLHKRIKMQCAMRGQNMADELRKLLETNFPEEYDQKRGEETTTVSAPGNTTL
jgi:hypothetical protein